MPMLFATVRSTIDPFATHGLNTPATSANLSAPLAVVWQDGTIDSWPAGTPVLPASTYGGTSVDSTACAWLLTTLKGVGFRWIKEQDKATADTVLAGTYSWTVLRRMADGLPAYPIPQV